MTVKREGEGGRAGAGAREGGRVGEKEKVRAGRESLKSFKDMRGMKPEAVLFLFTCLV